MKPSTFAVAFGPATLLLAAQFALAPAWLAEWGLVECIVLGAAIGGVGAVAAHMVSACD